MNIKDARPTRRSLIAVAVIMLTARVPAIDAAALAALPGQQRQWTLTFNTRLEQPGSEQPAGMSVTGEWISTVTAVRPGEYDAEIELANPRLSGRVGGVSPEVADQLQRRLARRFWATYRSDGALLTVHFFKDTDPSDRNLLQMVASETQLVRPDRGQMVWTVLERDGAGSYLAIYNRGGSGSLIKRKLKYVASDAGAGVPPGGLRLDIDQSELRFALDADGEIAGLDGNNRVRIAIPLSDQPPLLAVTEVHFANLQRAWAPERIGSLAGAGSEVVSEPIVTHRSAPEQLLARQDESLLEGRTTKSLLDAAIAKGDEDPRLPDRLAALFRRRSEAAPAAAALLRQSGPQKRITNALGSAGSPSAIQALGGIARDPSVPAAVRVDALNALVVVHHPSPEAMRMPLSLLDAEDPAIVSAARLMSGALARAGRPEHRAEADAIDAALIARYRKAQEVHERCDLLAALGNSAGPSVLPVIEEALRDPRPSVRAEAARGLRLAEASETDGLLSATITTDADAQVRSAGIFAASFRPMTALLAESLQRAARSDEADAVRSSAVGLLREHPDAAPGIRDTLAWVAANDPKPGLRRLAHEALAAVSLAPAR